MALISSIRCFMRLFVIVSELLRLRPILGKMKALSIRLVWSLFCQI
jgi:hypothetical protein